MPTFESIAEECDHEQVVGLTTARRQRTRSMGDGVTLWCSNCGEFHGFEPKGSPFE